MTLEVAGAGPILQARRPEAAFAPGDIATPRDWLLLLKPRVMMLVVYTGAIGLVVAPTPLHPVLAFAAVLAIAVGGGAAGALNMWFEYDIDAVMKRTAARPIPAGRIAPDDALGYGVVLAVASVLVMGLATNWLAALLLAASIAFYVLIYTIWLKRRTPYNIVIGGAAGAFPPAIGWAAATGQLGIEPLVLFAIIFFWTPPHFWALSLWAHTDYARAGVPMLPVTHGARATRWQILYYTLLLFPLAVAPWPLGFAGPAYGVIAIVLGLGFIRHAILVLREPQDGAGVSLRKDRAAKRAFAYSLLYLFVLFGVLPVDRLVMAWL